MSAATTAYAALGHHAVLHVHGAVERDDHGIYLTGPDGRRWYLQHDDPVTITDTEATP